MISEQTENASLNNRTGQISIEWGTPLRISCKGFTESYKSVLTGMERDRYLICNTPDIPGIWTMLYKMNQIIVRYIHRGIVYGFKCTLMGIIEDPLHLMILSYPDNIETVKLRKHERITCLIPATASIDSTTYKGAVLDISMGGCSFKCNVSSNDEIAVKENDAISMQIAGLQGNQILKLGVANIRRYNKKITLGGQFRDLDGNALAALQDFIDTLAELEETRDS